MEFFDFWICGGLSLKGFFPSEFLTIGFLRFCPRGFGSRELYEFWFLGDFFQWDYVLRDFILGDFVLGDFVLGNFMTFGF